MEPQEYVEAIKLGLRINSQETICLEIREKIGRRVTENWMIYTTPAPFVHIECKSRKLLQKLIKILTEADIDHELVSPHASCLNLRVFAWRYSNRKESIL